MQPGLRFVVRPETFSIHRLPADHRPDLDRLRTASWYSITRTGDEVSIVAPEGIDFSASPRQDGWACLQIAQVLDFGLVGLLAGVSGVLAQAKVSIFTISTYDTDYILVRSADLPTACAALRTAGHVVESEIRLGNA